MWWKKGAELLKLCNTPPSIISPFPLFAVSLFLLSRGEFNIGDLPVLFAGIAITLFSNFGSNLWNHCNDIKEDEAAGKKTILTQNIAMRKTAYLMALLLYVFSMLAVYYLSLELDRPIYLFFSIWVLLTWWYSDNLILKKVTGFRLKEHYMGELVTYGIACPMYTLTVWLIYSDFNALAIILSIAFFFFSMSGLLLKDLKDISGDKKAGLRTFGVVFPPSRLIRYSCWLMILFYLIMLNPFTMGYFGNRLYLMALPFVYFLKNTFIHMYMKNWILDKGDLKALRGFGISIQTSVIFMGLSAFI